MNPEAQTTPAAPLASLSPQPLNAAYMAASVCVLSLYLLLTVGTALTSRPITDEGLFADPAYTLATKGYMGSPALRENPHLLRVEQKTYWIFPLDPVVLAAWYRVFGVGLTAMRVLSICFGLLGLSVVFVLVRRLTRDSRIACLATAFTALDYFYVYGSASGRMDIMCTALGYTGLASYVSLRERSLPMAMLVSNACVVCSGVTHPNGFLYFMGLVFFVMYFDRRRIQWKHVALAAVPYLIGAALWGQYISRDPYAFLTQLKSNVTDGGRLRGLHNPALGFVREITERYSAAYGFGPHSPGSQGPIYLKSLALLAYISGLIGAISIPALRRRSEVQVMLGLMGIYFCYHALFDGQKAYYYLIHYIPIYATLLAIFISWLLFEHKVNPFVIAVPLGLIIAVQLGGIAYRIRLNTYKNIYDPAVLYLRHNTQGARLINGNIAFVFGMGFPDNFVDDSHLREMADYVVVDSEVADRWNNSRAGNPDLYRRVQATLSNCYHKVYDENFVQIYSLIDSEKARGCGHNGVELGGGSKDLPDITAIK